MFWMKTHFWTKLTRVIRGKRKTIQSNDTIRFFRRGASVQRDKLTHCVRQHPRWVHMNMIQRWSVVIVEYLAVFFDPEVYIDFFFLHIFIQPHIVYRRKIFYFAINDGMGAMVWCVTIVRSNVGCCCRTFSVVNVHLCI